MKQFFEDRRPHEGLTYEAYVERWKARMELPVSGMDKSQRKLYHYAKYNLERSERVTRSHTLSSQLREAVECIDEPQLWMVLTEDWCGDSAFNLPIIAAAAARSSLIDIRILPRDANLDIMDQYLTDNARSIPKLVAFSSNGEELFMWGPRPEPARLLRLRMKEAGADPKEMTAALVDWYDAGGWCVVDEELTTALETVVCAG
jgi:hypothetical protein